MFINEDVKSKAKERIVIWFGEDAITDTNTIIDDKLHKKTNEETKNEE